jgi:hypothetical protein
MSGRRVFVRHRVTHELRAPLVTGTHGKKVAPSFGEAQSAVWPASNPIRVVVVLPVVLPEAYGTDLVVAALAECDEAAAGTAVWAILG